MKWGHYLLLSFIFCSYSCFANRVKLDGEIVIDQPTVYKNATLDMSQTRFIITNNATLDIENSTINSTISPTNPFFITVENGSLIFKNNQVNVTAKDIPSNPDSIASYYLLKIQQGNVNIVANKCVTNHFFSTGFLLSVATYTTMGLIITDNKIYNFHGGIYLNNSNHAWISHNLFSSVSYASILNIGNYNTITKNVLLITGNGYDGNGIDIVQSHDVLVSNNFISNDSCYSILILQSQNVVLDRNMITSGITYGIAIFPSLGPYSHLAHLIPFMKSHLKNQLINKNIKITRNYLSQNRFGIAATDMDSLTVKNNYFLQRFLDDPSRKFWTDNTNLLINVSNLIWENNLYKEAYTQEVPGNNIRSLAFVNFPITGGVTL